MYHGFEVTAVVVAAGKGSRMKSRINKQFLMLKDKPVLAHTLAALQECEAVDRVVVAAARGDIEYCSEKIVRKFGMTKVEKILAGGQTRQQSVALGLQAAADGIVLVHDGARPFVDCSLIRKGIRLLLEQNLDGTACAVPLSDTVKVVGPDGAVEKTLDRESLRAVQTPQCFVSRVIKEVHRRAAGEGLAVTDDLALLEHYGYRVGLYRGRNRNIKITTPQDLLLAAVMMEGGSTGE